MTTTAYISSYVKDTNVIEAGNENYLVLVLWVAITIGRLAGQLVIYSTNIFLLQYRFQHPLNKQKLSQLHSTCAFSHHLPLQPPSTSSIYSDQPTLHHPLSQYPFSHLSPHPPPPSPPTINHSIPSPSPPLLYQPFNPFTSPRLFPLFLSLQSTIRRIRPTIPHQQDPPHTSVHLLRRGFPFHAIDTVVSQQC